MFRPVARTASNSKITRKSQINADIKQISSQLNKKLRLVKSELRLKGSHAKSIIAHNINSGQKGKTVQFLDTRRESILNSHYNLRKNNLIKITKENKKIYERINSQKSNYSSRVLNKSCDSARSASSRVSQRSSRSRTMNLNGNSRNTSVRNSRLRSDRKKAPKPEPVLKVQNINSVKKQQILNFNKVFLKSVPSQPAKSVIKLIYDENHMDSIKEEETEQKKSMNKFSFNQYTPDRPPRLTQKNHKTTIGLPEIKETTPQRKGNLERVIESLGYRYRF